MNRSRLAVSVPNAVKSAVALLQRRALRVQHFAVSVLECLRGQVGVQRQKRIPQAICKHDLLIALTLGE
jgi:hypothetical protein